MKRQWMRFGYFPCDREGGGAGAGGLLKETSGRTANAGAKLGTRGAGLGVRRFRPMKIWIQTGALIAAVWLIAAVVVHFAEISHPTAASVAAYAGSINLDALQGEERAKAIARMEDMVNRLAFDERQQLVRAPSRGSKGATGQA